MGVTANGGKRWLNLHVIYLQPSELFKLFTVLFIAWLVQHHHDELGQLAAAGDVDVAGHARVRRSS